VYTVTQTHSLQVAPVVAAEATVAEAVVAAVATMQVSHISNCSICIHVATGLKAVRI
jgi:hypothetical protein